MDQSERVGDHSLGEWIAGAEERLEAADPLNYGARAVVFRLRRQAKTPRRQTPYSRGCSDTAISTESATDE